MKENLNYSKGLRQNNQPVFVSGLRLPFSYPDIDTLATFTIFPSCFLRSITQANINLTE